MARWLFTWTFLIVMLALSGCASVTPQADRLLQSPPNLPATQEIANVPFVEQSAGHCGPATLTMAMKWAGAPVTIDEISSLVYTPGMKGSLQLDMVSAARRKGFFALPIEGLDVLLAEVAAGNPVIVFENLALSWLPQWHYAIVLGYDLPRQEVIMHSGPEAFKRWDLRKFERSWKLGEYWGLVVLPTDRLSATGSELAHAKAAAALEQLGKLAEAKTAYRSILARWPQSLAGNIGAANVSYANKDLQSAATFLKVATESHPESSAARHNLDFVLRELRELNQSRQSKKLKP